LVRARKIIVDKSSNFWMMAPILDITKHVDTKTSLIEIGYRRISIGFLATLLIFGLIGVTHGELTDML
jgi:hypothetical protein